MSDLDRIRVRISGRVQGVGYRAWLAREAGRLGLRGWVRNRRDGTVEAELAGPADALAAMEERCRTGPAAAVVSGVTAEAAGPGPADTLPSPVEIRATA